MQPICTCLAAAAALFACVPCARAQHIHALGSEHAHDHHHHHAPPAQTTAAEPPYDPALTSKLKQLNQTLEDQGIFVETATPAVRLGGYVDTSYTYNFNGPDNGRSDVNREIGGGDFNVNQVLIALEKELSHNNDYSAGFKIEFGFGEDLAAHAHAHDHGDHHDHSEAEDDEEDFAAEVHVAYATFRVPIGNGLDFTVGKFHALNSFEFDERPYNINYSYGLLRTFLEPVHHVGFHAKYNITEQATVWLGMVNGWDGDNSVYLDDSDFSKAIIAAVSLSNRERNAYLRASFFWAPQGDAEFANVETADGTSEAYAENDHIVMVNLLGQWQPRFANERLTLGFNATLLYAADNLHRRDFLAEAPPSDDDHDHDHDHDVHDHDHGLGHEDEDDAHDHDHADDEHPDDERRGRGEGKNSSFAFGLGPYAKYQFNDIFSLASRAEYLHSDDGTLGFVDGLNGGHSFDRQSILGSQTDLYSWTITAGFDIFQNTLLRLEYRLDWASSDDSDTIFENGDNAEHLIAANVAYLF